MNKILHITFSILFVVCCLFISKTSAQNSEEFCLDKNLLKYSKEVFNVAKDEVKIVGQVKMPTTYKIKKNSSVLEAIAMAGGGGDTDKKVEIKLIRLSDDKKLPLIINVDYRKLKTGEETIKLEGGELIFVAENCLEKGNPIKIDKLLKDKIFPTYRLFPPNNHELSPLPENIV